MRLALHAEWTKIRTVASPLWLLLGMIAATVALSAGATSVLSQVIGDPHWQRLLQQIGPMSAGLTIQATTDLHSLPLPPWAGLGVTAGWAAAALVTGGLLLRRRDP